MRSWPDWQWQYSCAVRSRVSIRGNISPRCVPGRLPMAKCSRNAFPGGNPWQVFHSMHPKSGLGRENRQFVAAYRRRVSEMSWLWQDMRAMHPKSPANRLSGTHLAKILPGRGPFRCTGPSNHAQRANLAILLRLTFRRRDAFAEGWDASSLPARWCRFGHPCLAGEVARAVWDIESPNFLACSIPV